MQKKMPTLKAMLIVVLIAVCVGGWVSLASAGAKEVKPKAPVPETGQTECWETNLTTLTSTLIACAGTGQDGESQAGVPLPTPRFVKNDNGTVTDRLTGLIWLQQANCFGAVLWPDALMAAKSLASGDCELTDGSQEGDWRLPNARELHSLINFDFVPTLSNTTGTAPWTDGDPFFAVQLAGYWSSTTVPGSPYGALAVQMASGQISGGIKRDPVYVWPVRGGN
jgi:uncharacterized protein DUF1566